MQRPNFEKRPYGLYWYYSEAYPILARQVLPYLVAGLQTEPECGVFLFHRLIEGVNDLAENMKHELQHEDIEFSFWDLVETTYGKLGVFDTYDPMLADYLHDLFDTIGLETTAICH